MILEHLSGDTQAQLKNKVTGLFIYFIYLFITI